MASSIHPELTDQIGVEDEDVLVRLVTLFLPLRWSSWLAVQRSPVGMTIAVGVYRLNLFDHVLHHLRSIVKCIGAQAYRQR